MSSLGEQLRAAREAKGLSVQQIAEQTKLKLVQVEALETGDYSSFPAMVYVRGSIRIYADVVKIDPAPLLEELKDELQGKSPQETPVNPYVARDEIDSFTWRLAKAWRVVLPIVVVAVLFGGTVIGYRLWKNYEQNDPLINLGSGQYEGVAQAEKIVETLKLPPVEK